MKQRTRSRAGLTERRVNGTKVQANDIKQAAEQFEAIFLRNMLKEMRKTNELFDSKDNPFNSDSVRRCRGFMTMSCVTPWRSSNGIGIAAMIVKQLSPKHKSTSAFGARCLMRRWRVLSGLRVARM